MVQFFYLNECPAEGDSIQICQYQLYVSISYLNYQQMIFQYQSFKVHAPNNRSEPTPKPHHKHTPLFQGRKINNNQIFNPKVYQSKRFKAEMPIHKEEYVGISIRQDPLDQHKYRQAFFKKDHGQKHNKMNKNEKEQRSEKADKQKWHQAKAQPKYDKKTRVQLNREQKSDHHNNKSYSKSKSKSKGITKSKSLKQLMKKTKSMLRLDQKDHHTKQTHKKDKQYHQYSKKIQRKSHSPSRQNKSVISYAEKKNYKSHLNSKSHRQITSEQTTQRQRSKNQLKISQIYKNCKKIKKNEQNKPFDEVKKKPLLKVHCKTDRQKKKNELQKEDVKLQQGKQKSKIKQKTKKVIISQHYKTKRQDQDWQLNQDDEFLVSKNNKQAKIKKSKEINMVDTKRNERLSLNSISRKDNNNKNNKTQVQLQHDRSRQRSFQEEAAITIQKIFRGYLTRKYIRECFEHNAAINIQRIWRGYQVRKYMKQYREESMKKQQKQAKQRILQGQKRKKLSIQSQKRQQSKQKILQQEQYLLQFQSSKQQSQFQHKKPYNQDWTHVLEEILQEQTINESIKKKIEKLLQQQRSSFSQADYKSNKSQKSNGSSLSNQVINNEINSEKLFFQQEKLKKLKPNMNPYISPTHYKSPNHFKYSSPQHYTTKSPANFIENKPDQFTSSQLLISNLKNIQKFHKQRLQNKANNQKEELNNMLIKNKLSPRTHEKKFKLVEQLYENQLQKFNESINEIVKNCILYKQQSPEGLPEKYSANKGAASEYHEQLSDGKFIITPKKQLMILHNPGQLGQECTISQKLIQNENIGFSSPRKTYQKSQQFCQYYQAHKQQLQKEQFEEEEFDSSYQFIQEYLINLIDFVRQFNNGESIQKILHIIKKPRNHNSEVIFKNLKIVTEASEDENLDNSFKLPMYKYIDMDEQVIEAQIIEEFNLSFMKLQKIQLGYRSSIQECFIKMIVDCMNQALNSLRPTSYIFTFTHLSTVNFLKNMEKVPIIEAQINGQEMQYQFMCAQALNKIFYWNKLQWGKIVNIKYQEQADKLQQMKILLMKQQEISLVSIVAKQNWEFLQQLVELIGVLSQDMLELIIYEEIAAIWQIFINWNEKNMSNYSPVSVTNSKDLFKN